MKFLVTGGNGYLGGRLSQYLRGHGHSLVVVSRNANHSASVDQLSMPITNPPEGIDAIVHLASPDQKAAGIDPPAFLAASTGLTWNICELATRMQPMPLLIYLSTFHVYGAVQEGRVTEESSPKPVHPYALGKWMGEQTVQLFRRRNSLSAVCIRLSNAFGAPASPTVSQWHLVFNDLCRQAVTTGTLEVRTAGQQRNFVTITDTVRAIEFIAATSDCRPSDGILHMGSALNLSIGQVAQLVAERARIVLAKPIEVVLPEGPNVAVSGFEFATDRLAAYGFNWAGSVAEEIDNTLRICRDVSRQ